MTTQDYIDAEVRREQQQMARMAYSQRLQGQYGQWSQQQAQVTPTLGPSEVILLRAKVQELTDKLAAERGRCAEILSAQIALWDADDHDLYGQEASCLEVLKAKIMEGK